MPLEVLRVMAIDGDGVFDNEDVDGADDDDVDDDDSDGDVGGYYDDDDGSDADVDHVERQRIQRRGSLSQKLLQRQQMPGEP